MTILTVSDAASVAYYTQGLSSDKGEGFAPLSERIDHRTKSGKALSAQGNYYVGQDNLRSAEWGGKFADSLGLKGQPFTELAFKRVMFGLDPRTGEKLHKDIPSVEQQERDEAAKQQAEKNHDRAKDAYWTARAEARDAGRNPDTDTACLAAKTALDKAAEMKRAAKSRQTAKDLTFSMPKAMSMYIVKLREEGKTDPAKAQRASEIMAAWTRSIHGTMGHIERKKALLRPRDNGRRNVEPTAGIVYAVVGHVDARPVDGVADPEVHSHVLLMNRAMDHDGDNQSVWFDEIVTDEKTLGADQRLRFVQELKALGIETALDKFDDKGVEFTSFTLYGVDKAQKEEFSRRGAMVSANRAAGMDAAKAKKAGREAKNGMGDDEILEICAERMDKLGLTTENMLSSKRERHAKWREDISERQAMAWEAEHQAYAVWTAGSGPRPKAPSMARPPARQENQAQRDAWDKRVDALLQARIRQSEVIPSTPEEMLAAVMRRTTVVTIPEMERMILEWGMTQDLKGRDIDEWRDERLAEMLALDDLVEVARDETTGEVLRQSRARGLDRFGRPVFTSAAQREAEERFYGKTVPEMLDDRSQRRLNRKEANAAVDVWEQDNNVRLSKQQRRAVADILSNPSRLGLVQAWAGTGKTMMSRCAIHILRHHPKLAYEVLCLAPSNKAAVGLRDEVASGGKGAGKNAADFAKDIGVEPEKAYTPESLALAVEGGRVSLGRNTLVYADESSMLDGFETRRLFDAAVPRNDPKTGAETGGARFVLLGDERQIQAIESGNVIKRLSKICMERVLSGATEAAARNGMGEEGDEIRQISMMTEGWGDYRNIQRQARAVGKQIVAWAESGRALKALDSIERRGMLKRHGTDAKLIDSVSSGYVGRACSEAASAVWARKAYMSAAKKGDPAATAAAQAVWESSLKAVQRFHEERVILAETNERVNALNDAVRAKLREQGLIGEQEVKITVGAGGKTRQIGVSIGDRLAWSEKMTHADAKFVGKRGAAKGKGEVLKTETGTVVGISFDEKGRQRVHVALDGDRGTVVVGSNFRGLGHAYAMTVAKSQGISRDHVEVVGSARSNCHNFLVAISRFKKSMSVHVLEHEMEGYAKTIAVEHRKIEATDLAAAEYGFLEPELAEIYKEEARAAGEASKAFDLAMERLETQSRGPQGRETDAAGRNPLAARIVDLMRTGIEKLSRRPLPSAPDSELTKLMPALERAAAAAGRPLGHSAKLGVAAMSNEKALEDGAVREWLALSHDADKVFAFNQRTGQIEGWEAKALERRKECVESARQRLGLLGAAQAEPPRSWPHEGRIVEIGESPFGGREGARIVPHVVIELADGSTKRMQGVDLRAGVEAAGLKAGDWALLDDRKRTEVTTLVRADDATSAGSLSCKVIKTDVKGGRTLVETPDGNRCYAQGEAHDACVSGGKGAMVELGFKRVNKVVWEAQKGDPPNLIPVEAREAAWAAISKRLGGEEGFLEASRRMGHRDGELCKLWRGPADIVEPAAEIDGAPAWQMAGARISTDELGATTATATRVFVVHGDADRLYCVAATEDRSGLGWASERIIALPRADSPHLSVGQWGIVVAEGGSARSVEIPEALRAAEAGDVQALRSIVAEGRHFERDALGRTALHAAAESGRAEVVSMLRKAGLDPMEEDAEGRMAKAVASNTAVAEALVSPLRQDNPRRDSMLRRLEAEGLRVSAERLQVSSDLHAGKHTWSFAKVLGQGGEKTYLLKHGADTLALTAREFRSVTEERPRPGAAISFDVSHSNGVARFGRGVVR